MALRESSLLILIGRQKIDKSGIYGIRIDLCTLQIEVSLVVKEFTFGISEQVGKIPNFKIVLHRRKFLLARLKAVLERRWNDANELNVVGNADAVDLAKAQMLSVLISSDFQMISNFFSSVPKTPFPTSIPPVPTDKVFEENERVPFVT